MNDNQKNENFRQFLDRLRTEKELIDMGQRGKKWMQKDFSWEREIKEYINCVRSDKKIYNGNIYDAIAVMQMIDTIYKSDSKWRKKFFNK